MELLRVSLKAFSGKDASAAAICVLVRGVVQDREDTFSTGSDRSLTAYGDAEKLKSERHTRWMSDVI